ncbi:TRAFAC clade GTPase domain-containing protein [Actinobacillus porcinus]|uniref:TRAFAC clade GTPase domain-containing protein n=1 Tax=Actinobacillus porcinus TaxID=51048 RepID=UPI00235348E0|nr:ribonucleoside-triphosphate reductase [Actinobacillus porcinus]
MLKNPFEPEKTDKPSVENNVQEIVESPAEERSLDIEKTEEKTEFNLADTFKSIDSNYVYTPSTKQVKLDRRNVEKELTDDEYQARLAELNTNAHNKHYVLFFGRPASGKTWIIGSILHYMKNFLGGVVYLDTQKTTESEEELFYQLQDRFSGIIGAQKLTSTESKQYFELHISFTPNDPSKPPMDIIFVDASGEHSEKAMSKRGDKEAGKLPNYLTAILESDVNTKLAFVYDQSIQDEAGHIPQINTLNAVFTQIQHIQNSQGKKFPKALLLSKADKIFATDMASVERAGYDPMVYAINKIPSFANSFFNEDAENKTIFYKMGKFSVNSDLVLEFDKECPEKLFRWIYMTGTGGTSPVQEPTFWDKFKRWFSGAN